MGDILCKFYSNTPTSHRVTPLCSIILSFPVRYLPFVKLFHAHLPVRVVYVQLFTSIFNHTVATPKTPENVIEEQERDQPS